VCACGHVANLGFHEMTDPHFSHDGNRNGLDDLLDHVGVAL